MPKMLNKLTAKEKAYLGLIKEMRCVVCDQEGPSDAHHVKQHRQYICIPLCKDCHQGPLNGWHGQRNMWKLKKMDELDALNETIRRILEKTF